jgi:hypothetical protein
MAKLAFAFADNSGALHANPEDAALADLSAVLGRIGAESGITNGLAKMILEKRSEIEQVFADLDHIQSKVLLPVPELVS